MSKNPTERPTVEEALLVVLDHADESGGYSEALLRNLAGRLGDLKIAVGLGGGLSYRRQTLLGAELTRVHLSESHPVAYAAVVRGSAWNWKSPTTEYRREVFWGPLHGGDEGAWRAACEWSDGVLRGLGWVLVEGARQHQS